MNARKARKNRQRLQAQRLAPAHWIRPHVPASSVPEPAVNEGASIGRSARSTAGGAAGQLKPLD